MVGTHSHMFLRENVPYRHQRAGLMSVSQTCGCRKTLAPARVKRRVLASCTSRTDSRASWRLFPQCAHEYHASTVHIRTWRRTARMYSVRKLRPWRSLAVWNSIYWKYAAKKAINPAPTMTPIYGRHSVLCYWQAEVSIVHLIFDL